MRQRQKLGLVLVAIALVIGGVVVGGLELFRQDAEQQAQREVQQTAAVAANQTGEALAEEAATLQTFGASPAARNETLVGQRLASLIDSSNFRAGVVLSQNGTVIALQADIITAQQREAIIGTNAREPYMNPVFEEGKVRISDPTYGTNTSSYYVEVAAPIQNRTETVGVVAARLDVSEFTTPIEALNESSDRTSVGFALANGSGTTQIDAPERFESSLSAAETGALYGTSWTVTVVEDRRPLDQRISDLWALGGVSLFLIIVVAVGLGYWEYTTNLRQTERLLAGFSELRNGNYAYTVSLSSATEWERIGEGYNELTRGLAERERAIREREQQLEVLNRVLRHNLRNDMNVIIGHAEMLPTMVDDDRVADASETIVRLGEELVSHGQKARQLETAMSDRKMTELNAVEVVTTATTTIERETRVGIETDLPETAPLVASSSLELAVENLIENAVEHNDTEDPWVEVAVEADESTVSISVADDGPGIPDHEREVLDSGVETALKHGSGVGLWLVQLVVERSGGELQFDERSPRGSVVSLLISRSRPDEIASYTQSDQQGEDAADQQ